MTKEEKKENIKFFLTILFFISLAVFFVSCMVHDKKVDEQYKEEQVARWNNGIHVECGGNLEYQQIVAGHSWMAYVYRCDKCGRVETFQHQMEFYDPNAPED